MIPNVSFCIPVIDATFTYFTRNNGAEWSSPSIMNGGVANPTKTISFPQCDSLMIEANFNTDYAIDLIHLSGLSLKGLSFEVLGFKNKPLTSQNDDSFILAIEDQNIEKLPRLKSRHTICWNAHSVSTVRLLITGLTQQRLDMEQILFCAGCVRPKSGFSGDTAFRKGAQFISLISQSQGSQRLNSKLRLLNLPFLDLEEDDADLLDYSITESMVNGFCLLRIGSDKNIGKHNFCSYVSLSGGNSNQIYGTNESLTITVQEAYEQ